jgi:hypothetical protein
MTNAYFENIKPIYLAELKKAKYSIHSAVAWFTDSYFYNLLLD